MAESYPNGKKTLWEKEKLLFTSNFPFSHSVFKRLVSKGRQKVSLCGNGLNKGSDGECMYALHHMILIYTINPFPNKPWLLHVCSKNLLKTLWEKEKLLVMSNYSLSHSVLYPFGKLSAIFTKFKIVVFKLFQFGTVQNL